jgi:hypothetical protein
MTADRPQCVVDSEVPCGETPLVPWTLFEISAHICSNRWRNMTSFLSFLDSWTLKMGPIGVPKRPKGFTTINCLIDKHSAFLTFRAEAWNNGYILCSGLFLHLTTFNYTHTHTHTHIHTHTHTHTHYRIPLEEGSARRRDLYLTTLTLTTERHPCSLRDSNQQPQQASCRRPTP